jgi:hypothetical protein
MPVPRPPRGRRRLDVLLGRAPLARWSDRLQALSGLLLALVLVVATPLVAVVAALGVHDRVAAEAAAQRAERSLVPATLVADAAATAPGPGLDVGGTTGLPPTAEAVWRTADGVHQGPVEAPAGSRAGSVVRIWVDRRGAVTVAPLGDGDVAAEAIATAVLVGAVLVAGAVLVHGTVLVLLDRSRMRRWTREWAATEPSWAGRT